MLKRFFGIYDVYLKFYLKEYRSCGYECKQLNVYCYVDVLSIF